MRIFGRLFGMLFGLIFVGFGLNVLLDTAVPTFLDWQAMSRWQPVQAQLAGVRKTSSSVEANYSYKVDGNIYLNDRVYVATFKDSIGSYQKALYRSLQHSHASRQSVTVWYDPQNPVRSVIDREMRWGLFSLIIAFCALFILVGMGVMVASFRAGSGAKENGQPNLTALREEWQAKARPDSSGSLLDFVHMRRSEGYQEEIDASLGEAASPWLRRKEWQSNRIRSSAKSGMYGMWVFALLWSAVSSPILFFLGDELDQGNYLALIGLLFPLVGLVLLKKAWNRSREWRRFGIIELVMDPFPGAIGGHVGGELLVNGVYDPGNAFKIELESVYSYMSGSGENRSRRENILWAEAGLADADLASSARGQATRLQFRFNVPDDQRQSDAEQTGDYHFWRLRVQAELPGVDLDRTYNIPVFKTGAHSRHISHDLSQQAQAVREQAATVSAEAIAQGDFDNTALARSLQLSEQGDEVRVYYPMWRNKALTLFALVFALGFDFAAYSMVSGFSGQWWDLAVGLFALPFALVGLVATLAVVYLPLNNLRVVIGAGRLAVTRRLFIFPVRRQRVGLDQIKRLELKRSGSTGQGVTQIKHFKILVHTADHKTITLAEGLDGEALAGQFKDYLARRMGLGAAAA